MHIGIIVVMYVAKVPNRGSPPAVLLRESYREAGKVKNRTLANLSSWPEAKVDALAGVLKGQVGPAAALEGTFEIARSLPHGHVAAVLGTARQLGLEELIDPAPSRQRDLVTAMAVAQVIAPDSKLAIARGLQAETAASSLGEVLGVGGCDEDDLYGAMDWLAARQEKIEDALAARHLAGGTLVLYDVSSAAFEGRTCPLGAIGHPKDGVRGRLQIVYGLLTSQDGVPVAIEVFEGNTRDPTTVAARVAARASPHSAPTGCCAAARPPSTPPPASATIPSATPATPAPSPPKPPWTASTCCAPASKPAAWEAARSSPPTRRSPRSSGPSGPSIPTWTSGPSATAPRPGSARTCSCG